MKTRRSILVFNKILSAFMAVVMISTTLLAAMPTVSADSSVFDAAGLRYTSNGNGTCVVSKGTCNVADITIPNESPTGDTVVTIGAFGESFNVDSGTTYGDDTVMDDIFGGTVVTKIRLRSIVIPDTVTTISAYAFESCSSLVGITFAGTPSQWAAIEKGTGWNVNTGNYTINFLNDDHVHTVVIDAAVAPTCTTTGLTQGSHCSVCKEILTAQTVIPATGHTVVVDAAVAATCTATGLTSGKHCSVCGTVIVEQHTVPMIDHTEVTDPMVTATCTDTGLTEGKHCSVCGLVIVAQNIIKAIGHNYIADVTVQTCTEGGYTTYTCDNCGDSYVDDETSALGHAVVVDAAVAPTCTATGLTEGSHCSRCNIVLTAQTVVPATGHTEATDAAVAPTCTATGLTEGKHCSVCNTVLIAQTVVPATGHTEVIDAAIAPTCTETGLTAGSHCSVCGAVLTAQETVPAEGHVWDYGVITVEPTTTSVGEKTYTCTVCGDTYTVDVPKISEGWDGDVADGYAGGDGTEDHPYQIATASQWAYFAEQINAGNETDCYYELTSDIIFNVGSAKNWLSGFSGEDVTDYIVGNDCGVNPFVGHFNGNGYRISGFYANRGSNDTVGLFGSTAAGNEAYIENLVITNSYFEGGGAIGALLGQTSGGYTEIGNIYVTDSVVIRTSGSHAGGIVGHNGNNGYGDPQLYIFSCVNAADIVTTAGSVQNVGGILGNGNGKSITVEDCLNLGDLTGYRYVSGIVGREDYSGAEINRCVNLGTVTATNTPSTYQREITISNSSSKKPTLNDCMALTDSFGRYTDNNDCEVIDIEDFTSGSFANTKSMYNDHPDFYNNWTDFSYTEVCMPKSLVEVIKGEIPRTKYYSGCNEHIWDDGVIEVEPTCEEGGLILYTCTVCGKTEEYELPAAGHNPGKRIKGYPATCTTDGRINYYYCNVCGSYLDEEYEEVASTTIPAAGHNWDSGVFTIVPTETTPGEKRYTCTVCGETRTETIYYEWDGVVAGGFAGGNGSAAHPYEIATAGQWAYFAEYVRDYAPVGEYFVLTADINFNSGDASDWDKNEPHNDMSDYQVGSWATPFVGTFDGQGHTLSGFYATGSGENEVGIFGCTTNKSQATIRNLIVRNSYFATTGCTIGAVVGQVRGGTTLIENIFVAEDVLVVAGKYSSNNNSYAGGILGHVSANNDTSTNVTVNNCVNGASVTAQGRSVAGIVGNGNSQKVYINDCLNIGRIQGASYVCGILGYGQNAKSTVTRCVNLGEIVGSSTAYQITQSADSSHKVRVTNCLALSASYGTNLNLSGCDIVTIDDFIAEGFLDTDEGGILYDYWAELSYDTSEGHVNDICVPYSLYDALSGNIPQSKLAIVQVESEVMMLRGASIRMDAPTGIRFMAKFSKDYIDNNEIERLGVIIAPETYVNAAGAFTVEALDALSDSIGKTTYVAVDNTGDGFRFSNISTAETDGFYTFNAVLGNMRENNYEVQFSAISFVELTDGTIVYSEYEPKYNCRNISAVSRSAYDDVVILNTNEGIPGYKYFVEEVEVDNVTKYKYSPYSQSRRNLLFDFFKGNLLETIADIFSTTKTPTEYTVGEDRYDIDCNMFKFTDTTKAEFDAFIANMQTKGYTLHATNGEDGINEICYQATLYNSRYTINIAYFASTEETFITVEAFRAVSSLQIKPQTQVLGTTTKFHELLHPTINGSYKFGECDIFQLSNGHFVIVDGAQEYSATTLVEYLEGLVGSGNTPIIDAWFFTHAHPDHIYCAWGIGLDPNLVSRVKVNGFYYTWPNDNGVHTENDYEGLVEQIGNLNNVIGNFRDVNGNVTTRYKLHAGMVFYIEELKVEILLTQDQLMPSEYKGKFNDSSTSFKFTVYSQDGEDSTFLIMGDAHSGVCTKLMGKYDYDTLHTTYFTSLHHGNNDITDFFQFICPDYIIYTAPSKKTTGGYKWLNETCKYTFVAGDVISIASPSSQPEEPEESEEPEENEVVPIIRFAMTSDTHISDTKDTEASRFEDLFVSAYNYADSCDDYSSLDAVVVAGDLTNYGDESELNAFKSTAESGLRDGTELITILGNHELKNSDIESLYTDMFDTTLDKHIVINGIHFIGISPNYSDESIAYLEQELAVAAADGGSDTPIIVFTHHHIKDTVYVSSEWSMNATKSAQFTQIFNQYPQVIFFSGHSHGPVNNPKSVWQDGFTAFGTGTLHYLEMESGMSYGTVPPNSHDAAQYYIVEIYSDNSVKVMPYNLMTDSFFKTPSNLDDSEEQLIYYVDSSKDPSLFRYADRAASADTPYFANNASLTITNVTSSGALLTIPQALDGDCIYSYTIECTSTSDGKTFTYACFSEYYFEPMPSTVSFTLTELEADTTYTVSVTPVDCYGIEGSPIQTSFTTAAAEQGVVYTSENPVNFYGTFTNFDSATELSRSSSTPAYDRTISGDVFAGDYNTKNTSSNAYIELASGKGYNGSKAIGVWSNNKDNRGLYIFATDSNGNSTDFSDMSYLRVWVDFTNVAFRKACFGLVSKSGALYDTDEEDKRNDQYFWYMPEGSTTWTSYTHGTDGCFGDAQNSDVQGFKGWLAFPISDFVYRQNTGNVSAVDGRLAYHSNHICGVYLFWDYSDKTTCTGNKFYLDEIAIVKNYTVFDSYPS